MQFRRSIPCPTHRYRWLSTRPLRRSSSHQPRLSSPLSSPSSLGYKRKKTVCDPLIHTLRIPHISEQVRGRETNIHTINHNNLQPMSGFIPGCTRCAARRTACQREDDEGGLDLRFRLFLLSCSFRRFRSTTCGSRACLLLAFRAFPVGTVRVDRAAKADALRWRCGSGEVGVGRGSCARPVVLDGRFGRGCVSLWCAKQITRFSKMNSEKPTRRAAQHRSCAERRMRDDGCERARVDSEEKGALSRSLTSSPERRR